MAHKVLETLQQQDPERIMHIDVQEPLAAPADAGLLLHLLNIFLGNAWKFSSRQASADISVGAEVASDGDMIFSSRTAAPVFASRWGKIPAETTGKGKSRYCPLITKHYIR